MESLKLARALVVAGSIVLFGTALFHASGYGSVAHAIQASGAPSPLVAAVKALWLMFSTQLAVLGLVCVVASFGSRGRRLVLLCALIPAADAALLFFFVGVFIGAVLLAIASLLLIIGGLLLPHA